MKNMAKWEGSGGSGKIGSSIYLLLTIVMLVGGGRLSAQEVRDRYDPTENAALNYYQAFSWYEQVFQPMSERSSEEAWQLQGRLFGGRYNDETEQIFHRAESFLVEMRKGSRKGNCYWDADVYNGGYLSVLSRTKSLVKLAASHTGYLGLTGDADKAIDSFKSIYRISENFEGEHQTLIGWLIRNGMIVALTERSSVMLFGLNVDQLENLEDFWRSCRAEFAWDTGDRIRAEIKMVKGRVKTAFVNDPQAQWNWLKSVGFSSQLESVFNLRSEEGINAMLNRFEMYGNEAAKVADVRDTLEFEKAVNDFAKKWDDSNETTMCEWTTPDELRKYFLRLKGVDIRMAMFEQALEIFRDGFESAKTVMNPLNKKPFAMERRDAEFALRAQLPENGGVLEMAFALEKITQNEEEKLTKLDDTKPTEEVGKVESNGQIDPDEIYARLNGKVALVKDRRSRVVEKRTTSTSDEILEWNNYFYDENGNLVGRMVRDIDGEIWTFSLRRFRGDGQVSHTYSYDAKGRLKDTLIHRYSSDGEWLVADKYDITDKKTGGVSTRPSGYTKKPRGEK